MMKYRLVLVMLVITILLCSALTVSAAQKLRVAVSQYELLMFANIQSVAIANPEIADVTIALDSEVLVVGKAAGKTTLHVWSAEGSKTYEIEVIADNTTLENEIKEILGFPNVCVLKVNKTIVLEGSVDTQQQKKRAENVAGAYGEKVVNLLEVTQPVQVKLEAKIIEISKEKAKSLGIKWYNSSVSGAGTYTFGQSSYNTKSTKYINYMPINADLTALIEEGAARILSQPNIITLSGEKASILVGGEMPVPVANDNNKITIEWKPYGIRLDIEPEVTGGMQINSKVKAEVSTLDWSSNNTIKLGTNVEVPLIKTRKTESAIALASGQTMAIGGLISTETTRDVVKIPFLADIPILGKLFQSQSFRLNETELIILVTPTIVDPADYVPSSTEEMKEIAKKNSLGGNGNGGPDQGTHR